MVAGNWTFAWMDGKVGVGGDKGMVCVVELMMGTRE